MIEAPVRAQTNRFVLRNASSGAVLATRVARARNAVERAVGLLTRATLDPDEGLWIPRCSAVHTIGMRVALDLYFVDKENSVVRIERYVKPNRLAIACPGACGVIELGAAGFERAIGAGDRLVLE